MRATRGRAFDSDSVALVVLLAVLFTNMVGIGAVFALLPKLEDAYDLPTAGLGLIGGASVLMAVAAQLTLARFADRGHTAHMLRAGLVTMVSGFAWIAIASGFWQFVAARALTGLGAGLFVPAARRVIVTRDPARAGELLGRATAVEVAGFVFGPPIAVALASGFNLRVPFVLPTILLVAIVPFVWGLTEPPIATVRHPGGVGLLLGIPAVRAAVLVGATVNLSIGAFEPIIAKQLDDLGSSDTAMAVTLSLFGVPYVFLTSYGGRLADRHGPHRVAVIALMCTIPVVAALGFAQSALAIALIGVLRSSIDTISTPAGITAMARSCPESHVATGQGLYGAVSYAMSGVAAILAAPLYDAYGPRTLWIIVAVTMLVTTAWTARLVRIAANVPLVLSGVPTTPA